MQLIEALQLVRRQTNDGSPETKVFLGCGFTPLHLQTFLAAELGLALPGARINVKTGLFGDLCGSLERLGPEGLDSVFVAIEWGDLDSRLALRTLGGWRPSQMPDIIESAARTAKRLQAGLAKIAGKLPTIVSQPTLPLPPMFASIPGQATATELELRAILPSLMADLSRLPNLRILGAQELDGNSPARTRHDLRSDMMSGFPYTIAHASALAAAMARLVRIAPRKKGLITDLDDTLWLGILGEEGVDGVSWHLDKHSHMHGLYQQFLASLSAAGVLVAVASKNDAELVERAFQRSDLLLSKNDVFPFEANWSPKSESVQRILTTWNIGPDAVVFIDDSPMEVAEVKAAFPEMECIVFPKADHDAIWSLVKHLRDLFGKSILTDDDSIRLQSIRDASAWRDASQQPGHSMDDFLKTAEARIEFESVQSGNDARAFELVNKTNQFNLNGKRFGEAEWNGMLKAPGAFALAVSYKDKFGALGKIAVLTGSKQGRAAQVIAWVMSCRAFSRRIEHQCLKHLFESLDVDELAFEYKATPRNGPTQEFFTEIFGELPAGGVRLSKEQFAAKLPPLFHTVEGQTHV